MNIQQIDATTQTEIVQTLSEKLKAHYIFPNVAEQICQRLQKHLEAGEYADIIEGDLFALAETADGGQLPDKMNIQDEIERREQRLARLTEAKKVLEARAQARYEAEKAEYEAKMPVYYPYLSISLEIM